MIMCIGEKMKTQRKTLTISKETTGTGLNRGDKLNERWINISAEKFVESSAHEIADEFTRVSTIETARFVSLAHGHQLSSMDRIMAACASTSSCPDEAKARSHNATGLLSTYPTYFPFFYLFFPSPDSYLGDKKMATPRPD